jgi:soluble lytic murein transglycosylase
MWLRYTIFILFIILSNGLLWGDIYMGLDENGNVLFTNVPTRSGLRLIYKEKLKLPRNDSFMKQIEEHIRYFSNKYGVDYNLVKAVIKVESDFNPNALSPVGAMGLMQLMPETAEILDVEDIFNPADNIDGGVRLLRKLLDRFDNNISLALAAYHAGANRVEKYKNVPPIKTTQKFVRDVILWMLKYSKIEGVSGNN